MSDQISTDIIRSLDNKKDLKPVADLIEACFIYQMDPDGKAYIDQLRLAVNDRSRQGIFPICGMQISYPIHGFVWEEAGNIIGNATIIPHRYDGKWYFLIANVAVHPDHRGRGIGRLLTLKAIDYLKAYHVPAVWLQVRDDNLVACNLYRSLGFNERIRRTTWISTDQPTNSGKMDNELTLDNSTTNDWADHHRWLLRTYPPQVTWYLPFEISTFKPGPLPRILRIINGKLSATWVIRCQGKMIGAATWQATTLYADLIWLAVDNGYENRAVEILLNNRKNRVPSERPIMINYPALKAVGAFHQAGFKHHNSLIWMEKRL